MNKITRYLRYKKHYQHSFKYELNETRNSAPGSKRLFKKKKLYLLSYLSILANLPNKSNHKKLFSQKELACSKINRKFEQLLYGNMP